MIHRSACIAFFLILAVASVDDGAATGQLPSLHGKGFVLAGQAVFFDEDLRPQFSALQVRTTASSTREGLSRWARTAEGRRLIWRFRTAEYEVEITEDAEEASPGRAPEPGIATMVAAANRQRTKHYQVILNPGLAEQYRGSSGGGMTDVDVMAATWAAEMLHVDFYADGIALPHHEREDFQERWIRVARQLGLPNFRHGIGE